MGDTPILRADALDDELYEPVTTLTGTELHKHTEVRSGACMISEQPMLFSRCACGAAFDIRPYEGPTSAQILDAADVAKDEAFYAETGGTVEPPEPKRQVPVVVSGVLHGYREE